MKLSLLFIPITLSLASCSLVTKPHPKQPEEVCLLQITTQPVGKGVSSKGLELALAAVVVKEVGGAIVNATAKALENYGKSFEASYTQTKRMGGMKIPGDSEPSDSILGQNRYVTFQRILNFKTEEDRSVFLAKSKIRADQFSSKEIPFGLIAMEYKGRLVSSSNGKSHSLQNLGGHLSIPKARRLGGLLKDKPGISVTVIIRESVAGIGSNTSTVVVPVKIDGDSLKFGEPKEGSDWFQSPSTGSYSIQVTVQETGKGKAYADKAAGLLKKLGDKGVDKAVEKVGG